MKSREACRWAETLVLTLFIVTSQVWAEQVSGNPFRETLLLAAQEIIESAGMCALVTMDHRGQPRVRTMDPFPPQDGMIVWLGTNSQTRKVEEIRNNPGVALYYAAPGHDGYVSIYGRAELVNDPKQKAELWKDAWEDFYKDREATYLLIKVVPDRIEVVSYSRGIVGNPKTWQPNQVKF